MRIVKNRKIPTIYELGLYGYYGVISLISASLIFVAFIICGGIPLTEWLDEKERNEGNNFDKYIF